MLHSQAHRGLTPNRLLTLALTLALVGALLPATAVPVRAEDPAAAAASGFSYFKFPNPQPTCELGLVGFNVSSNPWYERTECGFATFTITGGGANPQVSVAFIGPAGGTAFATAGGRAPLGRQVGVRHHPGG